MGIELGSVRAAMGRVRAGTNTQEDLGILLAELDGFLPPEPVLPLRDRALRMFTCAPGGMDGYEAALRAIDYVIAEMTGPSGLAPLDVADQSALLKYWRKASHDCLTALVELFAYYETNIRPARVARAQR